MNTLNLSTHIARNPEIAYTYMDDEMVIMGADDHLYYGINAVGAEIWSLLERNSLPLHAICEHLQQIYAVDESQCIADATHFVNTMREHNMVIVTE